MRLIPSDHSPFARIRTHRGNVAPCSDSTGACMILFHGAASKRQKADNRGMRLRATLASLLTAVLLSVSSAASNCEITCDLAKTSPSCHGSAVHGHLLQQMAGMPGMEHKASSERGNEGPALVATAPACPTHACTQQPAVFIEQKAAVAHVPLSTDAALLDSFQLLPEPLLTGLPSRGPPHFRPARPVSLSTTLRI